MALPVKEQATYWGIAAAVFVLVLWYLGNVLTPFILGAAIAYLLDPVADWLEAKGLSRAISVAIITVFGVFVFIILSLLIIPTLIGQASDFVTTAPEYFDRLRSWIDTNYPGILAENSVVRDQLGNMATRLQDQWTDLLGRLLSSFSGVLNVLVLFVISPVVAVYLLIDWDRMIARIDELLPRDHAPVIRRLALEMNKTLASFIRGQGTVCLILGIFYATSLMIAGLNFGGVIGSVAGLVTFIPYVGALIGGILAVGVAIFQTWSEAGQIDWIYVVIIYAIFQAGQFVEGNILTPKLVGTSVGLHPVWLLLALSVFGALFGFVGLLVAVPVAAMIGVLVRFGIQHYQASKLYKGLSE